MTKLRPLSAPLLLLALSFPFGLPAQTNSVAARGPSNRYLFILNTSSAMQPRADGTLQAMQDLLASGLGGQLRRGDTIGVWTYNQELNAGHFPLQLWTPETHRTVAINIFRFLKEQKYEKRASLDKVLPAMQGVIKDSEFITVILVSDGDQKIRGTPFDDPINQFFKLWHGQQQKAHMPFITVLRARNGSITDHTVNSAPWPVEIPPLPSELTGPAVAEKKPAPARQQPAALIVSGKKPDPVAPAKPLEESAVPIQDKPAQPAIVETNEAKKVEPAPIAPEQVSTKPVPAPPALPVVIGESNIPKAAAPKSGPALAKVQTAPSAGARVIPPDGDRPYSALNSGTPSQSMVAPSASAPPSTNSPASWSPRHMPGLAAAGTFLSEKKFWVAGVILAAVVIWFVLMVMRARSRPMGRISLVNRSSDEDQ